MQKLIDLIQQKNIEAAKAQYKICQTQMSERDRFFFDALLNQLSGNYVYSEIEYLKILEKYSNDVGAIVNLVAIYNEKNKFDKSINIIEKYDHSLSSDEFNLAKFDAYFGRGLLPKAENSLSAIKSNLKDRPAFKERKAALYIHENQAEKAIEILDELLLSGQGNKGSILSNLSAAYNKIGEHKKSFDYAKLASEININSWQSKLNMASSLLSLERYREAKEILDQLIVDGHRTQEIIINLARITNIMGDLEKSNEYCQEGLLANPTDTALLTCLADNYSILRNHKKSFELFERVLVLDPVNELANWHYSMALLRNENYRKGWMQYKWGFKRKSGGRGEYKFDKINEWQPSNKSDNILIWGEQGIGDQLMFSKFLKYLPINIKTIELQLESRMVRLMTDRLLIDPRIKITPYGNTNSDAQLPIGNLPSYFWDEYTSDKLHLQPFLKKKYKRNHKNPIRIGITWRGGKTERMQSKRSVPLGLYPRINSLSNDFVKIIQLQYSPLDTEIDFLKRNFSNKLSLPKYDATKDLDSWVDHIDSCDLIVSIDNSVVHFAGSMGIPTLVMTPDHPDFRWGLTENTNHWYESVELLRSFSSYSLDHLALKIDQWLNIQIQKLQASV
jgi:tetratricopeptide (TPR) repeat protein